MDLAFQYWALMFGFQQLFSMARKIVTRNKGANLIHSLFQPYSSLRLQGSKTGCRLKIICSAVRDVRRKAKA